jgi:hypothetical protein
VADELAIYDQVIRRFGDRGEPALAVRVAEALVDKGVTLKQTRRYEEARAVYDDVVRRFGQRREEAIAQQVAKALRYRDNPPA